MSNPTLASVDGVWLQVILIVSHRYIISRRRMELKSSHKGNVGSEDFGETLNRHGETGNGPDADVEHFPTTEKKGSLSYADAARGTKRYVSFE